MREAIVQRFGEMGILKPWLAACLLCVLVACSGSGVPMAPQRSPHFDAVRTQLPLGGPVFAYADIEGVA